MQIVNKRKDIASGESFPKEELLRFTVTNGKLSLSPLGRGYYLRKDVASLDLALRKKKFVRILRRDITAEEISLLKEAIAS